MKISFNINYHTNWGENLYVCGNLPQLGGGDPAQAIGMNLVAPDLWNVEFEFSECPLEFDFYFIVKSKEKESRFEWGAPHHFHGVKGIENIKIFSAWQDMPPDKPYYSSAFVDGILKRNNKDKPLVLAAGSLQLKVNAPMLHSDEVLAVCGEGNLLGNWLPSKALVMNDNNFPEWTVNIPLHSFQSPFEYKFVILKKDTHEIVAWETIDNRICGFTNEPVENSILVEGIRFANPRDNWKGAGTAIPVFSLRSEEDEGVGDFMDLRKMIDWCALTGQKILQVLPINDTTKTGTYADSYPYSVNSSFALHPMYLRVEKVGILEDSQKMISFREKVKSLNQLSDVDYEEVNKLKESYLRDLYAQEGYKTFESQAYKKFVEKNESWLMPYAAWRTLSKETGSLDSSMWGKFSHFDYPAIEAYCLLHQDEVKFHYFVQYHLDRQLREIRDYAHSQGVVLKGDIPIGIDRHSVDAWQFPYLYNMNCQAGAPPDDFSILGQNWGFPTYNWEEMAKDGFNWWKHRFNKMSEYFDAYRIDHILGFFRIWQIPIEAVHGLLGYFNPALPFSPEEMQEEFDFKIDVKVHTQPLILDEVLHELLGEEVDEVKDTFLDETTPGQYKFKDFIDTQRKIINYFSCMENSEKNLRISRTLLDISDDVLFIEDPYKKGHYHPRIAAYKSLQYRRLSEYEQECFSRLYNDFFYRRNNDLWYKSGLWKLPTLIDSTCMLCCAEDLGMIPACVPEVMSKLEILSLEIQRMPKDPKQEFGDTWRYPYFSVCTTSTHDMSGIRVWWEADRTATQHYYNIILHEPGVAPETAEPWVCKKILALQLNSPSMFCIIPLADWLSGDAMLRRENPCEEQINEPSNPNQYWRYRMHLNIEDLLKQKDFNTEMRNEIKLSGR